LSQHLSNRAVPTFAGQGRHAAEKPPIGHRDKPATVGDDSPVHDSAPTCPPSDNEGFRTQFANPQRARSSDSPQEFRQQSHFVTVFFAIAARDQTAASC